MTGERTCYICGKTYRFCPHCAEFANAPSYLNEVDSQDCKDILDALAFYWTGGLTKEEALEKLKGKDLSIVIRKDLQPVIEKLYGKKDDDKKSTKKKTADGD